MLGLSNQQCNNWEHAGRSRFIVENQHFDLALSCMRFGIKQPGPHLRIRRLLAGWPESACKAGDPGLIPGWNPLEKGVGYPLQFSRAFLVAQMVKNPPAVQETWVRSLFGKIPWGKAWQPTPVYLPGESLWTEEPSRLQSMESQRV